MLDLDMLDEQLKEIGIVLSSIQLKKIDIFVSMLIKFNKEYNLTAITQENDVRCKHIVDSLMINRVVDFDKTNRIIDVGTGAGFPGIPIAIAFPEIEITLLDSLQKRISFLDEIVRELEINNIKTVCERAEILGGDDVYREKYDLCVSRAVTKLSTLLEICIPFIKVGGYFVAYKGSDYEEELLNAKNAFNLLGIDEKKDLIIKEEIIPKTTIKRSFISVLKTSKTIDKFPRRNGIPFKRPL